MITFGTDDVTLAHYLLNKGHNVVNTGKNFEFEVTIKLCEDIDEYGSRYCSDSFGECFKRVADVCNAYLK